MTRSSRSSLAADARGQSETLAAVLLLSVAVLGVVVVAAGGAQVLADQRHDAEVAAARAALERLDADADTVALGRAAVRSVALGAAAGGRFVVDGDAGWIRVVHHNVTGGRTETLYNRSLGAVVYRNGDTTLAYQGGGVWRSDGRDGAAMVAPPEFHYRDETLRLPVVRVRGDGGVAGSPRGVVSDGPPDRPVFPVDGGTATDGPGAPYDGTGEAYHNPVRGGQVTVTVHSDFYRAWAGFFRQRTDGRVTVDPGNKTATVALVAPGTLGVFDIPRDGNAIEVRGIERGHSLDRFAVTLVPDRSDAAEFDNLQWTLYAEEGSRELEIHLRLAGPADDPATPCKEQDVSATVYYSDRNGDPYHGWHNETAFRTTCYDGDGDGVADETRLVANFTGNATLSVSALESDDLHYFATGGADRTASPTLAGHDGVPWEPRTYDDGDDERIGRLLAHYFAELGPDFSLVVDDKESDTVQEDASTGVIRYDGEGRVTFLHVTEHGIAVELE